MVGRQSQMVLIVKTTPRPHTALGVIIAGALLLMPRPGSADADSFSLTIKDHRFSPTTLEIPAGRKVTLVVSNLDPTPEEFESIELHREKVVAGGSQVTIHVGPLQPGRYPFFGDFNPTSARGEIIAK